MENLNAEQVKRGLECLNNKIDRDCDTCPIFWKARKSTVTQNCRHIILDAALALINSQEQRIKELTVENKAISERYAIQVVTAIELDKQVQRLSEENERSTKVITDLIREGETYLKQRDAFQNRAKYLEKENARLVEDNHILATEFKDRVKADTVNKMYLMIKERCVKGGIYPAFVASTITQVAKEMLEE